MAFTVRDYTDLIRLLSEHPEWQSELRRLLLSDDFQALPGIVRELAEAQRRAEERLERLEARFEALIEQVQALAEAQRRTEESLRALVESQQRIEDRVGAIRDQLLELRYREHIGAYFGLWLRQPRAVAPETLEAALSHHEVLEVFRLDLLVSGRLRSQPDVPVWLAVEIAAVVNEADVDRARGRATLLQRAGYRALPVVVGERLTFSAETSARAQNVAILEDGQGSLWEEAIAAWGVA